MRVLLTGATGFLGRRVARLLVEDGCLVRCAVSPNSDVQDLRNFVGRQGQHRLETRVANLTVPHECAALLEDCDLLLHLAAGRVGTISELFLDTVVPTRVLLNEASRSCVRRSVLVSCMGIYGTGQMRVGSTVDEECRVDPLPQRRGAYTYCKYLQEEAAWTIRAEQNLPLVVVRPGIIYGMERGGQSGRLGLTFGRVLLRMGGRQALPYTFVENCAEAVVLAGITAGIDGQVVNIVDDALPTPRDVVREYRRYRQLRELVISVPLCLLQPLTRLYDWYSRASRGALSEHNSSYRFAAEWRHLRWSNDKAKELLQWTPHVRFETAMQKTLQTPP